MKCCACGFEHAAVKRAFAACKGTLTAHERRLAPLVDAAERRIGHGLGYSPNGLRELKRILSELRAELGRCRAARAALARAEGKGAKP